MDIIVKETFKPLVWERVAKFDLPLRFGAIEHGRMHKLEKFLNLSKYRATPTLEKFLTSILTADQVDRLPDVIKFCYNDMEASGIDPSDVAAAVRLTYTLTCKRLGSKPKEYILSGHSQEKISKNYHDKLLNSGFRGGVFTFDKKEFNEARKSIRHWYHHLDWWADGIIDSTTKDNTIELTYRQQEVLHYIVKRGLTNQQIAKELRVSEQAVKLHVSAIMKKYGVKNRTQLALFSGARQI